MPKDSFNEELKERSTINFSFKEIESTINFANITKSGIKSRQYQLRAALPFFIVSIVMAVAIVIPLSVVLNPWDTGLQILNHDDIVTTYEKNCSFISSGFEVVKKKSNGTNEILAPSLYTVDSSQFRDGVEGTYPISIFLNSNKSIKTSFDVEVIDDEVLTISLGEYRDTYYVGETIIPSDITLIKECESGVDREAKITEYEFDTSLFNSSVVGTYEIKVTLISNPLFFSTYLVDVQDIDEADLSGRYAYKEPLTAGGEPTVFALEIESNIITSHYSEILIHGEMIKEVVDGEIHIRGNYGGTQTMTYLPSARTLLVSGIAGDPDLPCFRINRLDAMITVDGASLQDYEKEVEYVALNGHIPSSTLEYLTNRYGGVYLTSSLGEKVTHEMEFLEDTMLYVGFKPVVDDEKPYLGKWFDDSGLVRFTIDENEIYGRPYTVQDMGNDTYYIRLNDGSIFAYHFNTDVIDILNPEDYSPGISLNHYVGGLQCLVTLNIANYYKSKVVEFVVNKGEILNCFYITDTSIVSYDIPNYLDTPIEEDLTFSAYMKTKYMIDIWGRYGGLKDYFELTNCWSADRLDSGHSYWFNEYKDYVLAKQGWTEIIGATMNLSSITMLVHYDDSSTEELIFNGSLTLGETTYNESGALWQGLSCLGEYYNEQGEKIVIDEYGRFMYSETDITGYTYQIYEGLRVTSMSDSLIKMIYYYQDEHDNRIVKNATLELADERWVFTIDRGVYSQR